MKALLALSNAIVHVLERIARAAGWLLIVLMTITCVDVICRKLSIPIPYTKFQEMEWHLHAAIFALWMGYCYVINAHPRVDSYTEALPFRIRAWIELAGCLLFALPYMGVIVYFGLDFLVISYWQGEGSENVAGLHHRWVIKGVFVLGLVLVLAAIISVILRLVVYLFGGRPQEQVNLQIGHAVSEV
ncbi:MAG: TRAP transporter small permease subunit [Xanthobacteraceae bacterium]|jgi:TRAP-type mannitol/chloroaromatic compound transport system permease small subunit